MSQSFVFSPEWNGCRPSATRLVQKNYLFLCSPSVEGKGTLLPFGVPPPIIWLHFLFPLPMSGDPRSLRCKHLCDPHSLITVTFWLLDNFSSTWAITWHYAYLTLSNCQDSYNPSKISWTIWLLYCDQMCLWFGLVLWHINHCWLFNAKSCYYMYILNILFINTVCRYTQLNDSIVLFLTIQFSIS